MIRGIEGAGVFVRQIGHVPPEYLREHGIRWICVPVRVSGGRAANRDRSWYERALEADLIVTTFDWLPAPRGYARGLADAIRFSKDVGARAFIMNAEREFRGHPREAADYADMARAEVGDMALGLVSYSIPSTIRDFPWREFAERSAFGIPEVYDREGAFDPHYDDRAIEGYRAAGFRHVIPACGIYQRDTPESPFRWRTPEEVRRHLAIFRSTKPEAWLAWPIGKRRPPAPVLRALAEGWR